MTGENDLDIPVHPNQQFVHGLQLISILGTVCAPVRGIIDKIVVRRKRHGIPLNIITPALQLILERQRRGRYRTRCGGT